MTLPEDIGYWENAISDAGNEGERVLAFGAKEMPSDTVRISFDDVMAGVQLLGLVGFIDPPRPEAKEAIAECRSAGIDGKMLTGDHAATALGLARPLDLAADPPLMTGPDVATPSDGDTGGAV